VIAARRRAAFHEFDLDRAPPTGKIGITLRQRPQPMEMIGKDNPGVDAEGPLGAHATNDIAQSVDPGDQQIRAAVKQVHGKEEGSARNLITAIVWHAMDMPELCWTAECASLFRATLATAREQPPLPGGQSFAHRATKGRVSW
jgi:hypothetical protein